MKVSDNWPFISITIPTLNEEKNIEACLVSIFSQNYPKDKIEVIVVDNGSSDSTIEKTKKFDVKIITKMNGDTQVMKKVGLEKSKGDFWMWFDADMRMKTKNWLKKMVAPLVYNEKVVASVTRYAIKGDESSLTKFLTLDEFQRDPVYQFFSPTISSTFLKRERDYHLCSYSLGKIPPQGMGVFRKDAAIKAANYTKNKFMDLDNLVHLVRLGYSKFAYVDVGVYHYFMPNLQTLLKKRLRNIKNNYLGQDFKRSYIWFDLKNPRDLLKIFFWILYVHLLVPEIIRGIYKSIKYKTVVGLYQPIVSLLETDVIILGFVYYVFKITVNIKFENEPVRL